MTMGGASVRPVLRRPLVGLAATFLIGSWFGFRMEACPGGVLAAGIGFCLLALAGRGRWAVGALYAAVVCAGWARTAGRAERLSPVSIERRAVRSEEYAQWIGVIVSDPSIRARGSGGTQLVFQLRVEAVRGMGWERARGIARVTLFGEADAPLRYGDRIRISGRLRQADGFGERPRLSAGVQSVRRLETGCGFTVADFAYRARRQAQRILRLGLENFPEEAAVQTALLLGLREGLSEDLYAAFQRIGTFHIFAISGLHVGILFAFWIGALQLAGFSRNRWGLILIPLLWGYVLATGFSPSAVRAALMASCYVAAASAGRRPDSPSALAAAALISVAASPRQLLDPGFIFSFTVVAGLLASGPFLAGLRRNRLPPDLPRGTLVPTGTRILRRGWTWLTNALWISAFAWIASAPLSAWYSSRISPASLVGNLFTIPAATGIVLVGCCSLLSGLFSPLFAEIFNQANRLVIHALNSTTLAMTQIPGAYVHVSKPAPGWILGWFAVWTAALFLRGRPRPLALMVLLGLGSVFAFRQAPGTGLRAETFSSGGVPVTLIRRPLHLTLIADPGPGFRASGLIRELRGRGINRVDVLLLRVPLLAWSSAASAVADEFPVREIWAPAAGWRFPAFRSLVEGLAARGIPVRRLRAGDTWILPGGEEVDVLHPSADSPATALASALALRLAHQDKAFVLAGPVDADLADSIDSCKADPSAPRLIAILSPAAPGTWSRVLEAIHPEEVSVIFQESAPRAAADIEWLRERGIRWTETPFGAE